MPLQASQRRTETPKEESTSSTPAALAVAQVCTRHTMAGGAPRLLAGGRQSGPAWGPQEVLCEVNAKHSRTKADPGGPTLHLRTQWAWHVLEGARGGGMGHQTPSSTDLRPCNINGLACRKQSLHNTYAGWQLLRITMSGGSRPTSLLWSYIARRHTWQRPGNCVSGSQRHTQADTQRRMQRCAAERQLRCGHQAHALPGPALP